MEYVSHVTVIVPPIEQLAILIQSAVQRVGDVDRQRPVGVVLILGVGAQAREEAVLDPDVAVVAEAVAVKGGLQGAVVEHAEGGVARSVGCQKGVDVCDGLVQLLADALRDVAFGKIGRGGLGVVELDVGDDDDLAAVCLGEEGVVELSEAKVEGTAALQRSVDGGEILGAAAGPAQIVDARPDDGVEVEVIAPGRHGVQISTPDKWIVWRALCRGAQDLFVLDVTGDGPGAGIELERVAGILEFPVSSVVQKLHYI